MIILLFTSLAYGEFTVPKTYTDEHIALFEKGLAEYAPLLEIVPCSKGMCAVAKEDLPIRSPIITLPSRQTISSENYCPLHYKGVNAYERILLGILYAKFVDTSKSFLNAAVSLYSVEIATALNWTESEHELYNAASLWRSPVTTDGNYIKVFEKFNHTFYPYKRMYPSAIFELESWKWAHNIFDTRAFYLEMSDLYHQDMLNSRKADPNERVYLILPLFDMLNHDIFRKNDTPFRFIDFNKDSKDITLHTFRSFSKHREVYNFYGKFDSFSLLTKYGFVIPYNSEDKYYLTFRNHHLCEDSQNECKFSIGVMNINYPIYAKLSSGKIDKTRVWDLISEFSKRGSFDSVSPEELDVLHQTNILYRQVVSEIYRENDALSLRDLRREFISKSNSSNILMFAESERLVFYYSLKLIDKLSLYTLYKSLID